MRWQRARRSENVEDRRGRPAGGWRLGGGAAVLVLLLGAAFGIDPSLLLGAQETLRRLPVPGDEAGAPPDTDELAQFVRAVLGDTEDTWRELLGAAGADYRAPRLVLFTEAVGSACGFGAAATGPFYCPADERVYIDLGFYETLRAELGAPGDFAQAYVIAHEVGHHVQNLLGITTRATDAAGDGRRGDLSVRLELQADYLAGVWAHHAAAHGLLEPGDVEEAIAAAAAIGDDRLQRRQRGYVTPETFTHGTSAQRMRWFRRGYERGDLAGGDTFSVRDL